MAAVRTTRTRVSVPNLRGISSATGYFRTLTASREVVSGGRLEVFDRRLAVLRDVEVDFNRCSGKHGGDPLDAVRGQSEEEELYRFRRGFLTLPGARTPRVPRLVQPWLDAILSTVVAGGRRRAAAGTSDEPGWITLMAVRYGYANLFHTVTDLYNAFLLLAFLGRSPARTRVIIADGHPRSPLDGLWTTLFAGSTRISAWTGRHRFATLALNPLGYDSPLELVEQPLLPIVEEFRRFVLGAYGIDVTGERTGRLRVTLVRRRDYQAHPRNPSGTIRRKIANERELVRALRACRVGAPLEVGSVVLERLPIAEQLRIIAHTDVLVGMHGAGLAHALFLPDRAGLVETYPAYFSPETRYFRRMAEWRGLFYQGWQNVDPRRERPGFRTVVPPEVVIEALRRYVDAVAPGRP